MWKVQWVGFKTIARKETVRIFRIWSQTLLPSVITITLYFLIFGNIIGARLGSIGGYTYMQFIVPGLIMMAVINNAYSNVVSTFFSAKFQRNIDEMLVSPLSFVAIILGFLSGGLTRAVIVGFLVTAVSMFFAPLKIYSISIVILTIFLTSLLFCLCGIINAIFATKFDDIAIVPTFVLTPLTYLGGVFYSIDSLPIFWQRLSLLNPILYLVNCFRYGFLGVSDIPVAKALIILSVVIALLWSACIHLLKKGVGVRL
ncbi:ABC transporter permease [Candidatus Marinamargulisbacteria bacterium SCGC AAA071-K20]|nr:ABC transporter permease [Candidatus Marinamargulisbacteria bacterium SCGC AAA071-K20]